MTCDLDRLVDYWLGELAPDEEQRLEEHQWSCEVCTRRLGWLAELAVANRALMRRRGGLSMAMTGDLIDRLAADGVVMRHYRPGPNQDVACTIAPDDQMVVAWLAADPADDERVDLEQRGTDGALWRRLDDVPVDRARGKVVIADAGEIVRQMPDVDFRIQLFGVGPRGTRELGAYLFRHRVWPGVT